jgi:hypothetical protein
MSPTATLCSFTKASHFWAKSHWKGLNLAVRTVGSNPNPSATQRRHSVPFGQDGRQNPAVLLGFFAPENPAWTVQIAQMGLENAFFSGSFVLGWSV